MADYDRRNSGHRGGFNNRKRRYRGTNWTMLAQSEDPRANYLPIEDDDYDRRPQRRRYEEPLHERLRKQLLAIAESVR